MALILTPQQRGKLLARLINKAVSGQIDGDQFVQLLVQALGTNFDQQLTNEAQTLRNELVASKAAADAQSLDLSNQISEL